MNDIVFNIKIGKDEELLVHGMLRSALLPMSRALATPRAWE